MALARLLPDWDIRVPDRASRRYASVRAGLFMLLAMHGALFEALQLAIERGQV